MNRIDRVIIGHNTGNFQDHIAETKSMARFNGAYRNAQINALLLDGRRISYMDLFNAVRKQADPEAEEPSPFDPLGLASLHLASCLARNGASTAIVGEFQKGKSKLDELLRDEPPSFYWVPR